jgi:hypothetical protein
LQKEEYGRSSLLRQLDIRIGAMRGAAERSGRNGFAIDD